jgi:hypothetical protein
MATCAETFYSYMGTAVLYMDGPGIDIVFIA